MKYIVFLTDGMSGHPVDELNGKSVMEAADTDNFDKLASEGVGGFIKSVSDDMYPGSDTCNLAIMGYDPEKYYTGRSPLEAGAKNIVLGENDMAFRCNIVTLSEDGTEMEDFSAHHIDGGISEKVFEKLADMFASEGLEFYFGVGYRGLMIVRNADLDLETTAPHDIMGQKIAENLPQGKGADKIIEIMERAKAIFRENDFAQANSIWLWGEGTKPALTPYEELYGLKGSIVAAVDLIKGIGNFAGFEIIEVEGATGFIDTNFKGKAEAAVKALETSDYVFLHVEAADEAGHMGSVEEKIKAVENMDKIMLPILTEGLKKYGEYRLLITPDHPTPVKLRTHVNEAVPAIIWGTGVNSDENKEYNEKMTATFRMEPGYKIAEYFLKSDKING